MTFIKKHFAVLLLLLSISSQSQGLRTLGKKIINSKGEEVLLKGVGLGGWMLQEGYMMNSSGAADTQHEFIEKLNILNASLLAMKRAILMLKKKPVQII